MRFAQIIKMELLSMQTSERAHVIMIKNVIRIIDLNQIGIVKEEKHN